MEWQIQKICQREESVFLVKPTCGTVRQVSVPGAADAFMKNGKVIIRSTTGYFWEVDPDSGSRRRVFGQQPLL
jgi:hypothetical protein